MREVCPACTGDGRALSLIVEDRYRLFRCTACGTQFFRQSGAGDDSPANEQSEYWEAHKFGFYNDPAVRAAFGARYGEVVDAAEQVIGPIRSILDVGCGTGNFLAYAQGRGVAAWGVDLDPEPVADARSRGLNAFVLSDLDGPHLPEQFDALSMWDVIEHIIDPLDALKALLPRLRPGGALLFETPDGGFPVRRAVLAAHAASRGRLDYTPPLYYWEHKIYFTERGFRALMQRLGCEVVAVRRGISVREKMDTVFEYEAQRTGLPVMTTLKRAWPVLATAAQKAHLGNKLLVVARVP